MSGTKTAHTYQRPPNLAIPYHLHCAMEIQPVTVSICHPDHARDVYRRAARPFWRRGRVALDAERDGDNTHYLVQIRVAKPALYTLNLCRQELSQL